MATSNAAFSFSSPLSGTRRPSTGTRSRPQSGPASLAVLGLPAFFHPRHRACRQRCLIAQQPAQRQLEVTARQPVQIQIRQQIAHFLRAPREQRQQSAREPFIHRWLTDDWISGVVPTEPMRHGDRSLMFARDPSQIAFVDSRLIRPIASKLGIGFVGVPPLTAVNVFRLIVGSTNLRVGKGGMRDMLIAIMKTTIPENTSGGAPISTCCYTDRKHDKKGELPNNSCC